MGFSRWLRLFTLPLAVLLTVSIGWLQAAGATTLFERSLEKFQAEVVKASPLDFTFVVLGDSRGNDTVFKKALAVAKSYNPLFILHGGDYSESGSAKETEQFLALLNGSMPDVPVFVVNGNHENGQVFAEKIGPMNFTLESARLGLKLVAVDNAAYALKQAEQKYLSTNLATRRGNTFVAMHIPPKTKRWNWHTFTDGAAELARLLVGAKVTAAFFSHVHLYDRDQIGGVPAIITGGAGAPLVLTSFPGEAVYHIVVVRVKEGTATMSMVKLME